MYVNTVAHYTASAARHAGDPTWPPMTLIRRQATTTEGLGYIAEIISALATIGTTAYQIKEARDDKKDAEKKASKEKKKAKAEEAAVAQAKVTADQKLVEAQTAQQTEFKQATIGLGTGALVTAGLVGAWLFLRKPSKKKR